MNQQTRLFYLDTIRVYLTILVFYHHSAIAYGASGGWYYTASETMTGLTEGLFSLTMTIDQSFFMALFFFISAFLVPTSVERKGVRAFITDRIKRLVVPLVIYAFAVHPLICYALWGGCDRPNLGPMWFVFTLIVFESIYLMVHNRVKDWATKHPVRLTFTGTMTFAIASGLFAFALRQFFYVGENYFDLQLGYFALYITMYAAGIVAHHCKWTEQVSLKKSIPYAIIVVFACLPSIVWILIKNPDTSDFLGGFNPHSLFYAAWEPFMCVGLSYCIIALAQRYFNHQSSTIQWLSRYSFAFYFIHPAVVIGMTKLADTLPLTPVARLAVVLAIGIPLCFGIAYVLRKAFNTIGIKL